MGIRHRLTDSERDDLTKDVDDLDAVYMEKLRKDGISEDLLAQFRDLTLELEKDKEENHEVSKKKTKTRNKSAN